MIVQSTASKLSLTRQKNTDVLTTLDVNLLNYREQIVPDIRLRHRRQVNEIYIILNEVMIKNTHLNLFQNLNIKQIEDQLFLDLKRIIQQYLGYTEAEHFRFNESLNNVPDVWLSQQFHALLDHLLQHFLQQQLHAIFPFQIQQK